MGVIASLIGSGTFTVAPAHAASLLEGAPSQQRVKGQNSFFFKQSERCFMSRINHKRRRHGLSRLQWDKHLGYVGRKHARTMASSRGVWHDSYLGQKITHWRRLGQNTGRGRHCRSLTKSFFRSANHRYNMLGRWNFVGVGTSWAGGRLYVQQIYESRYNPGNIWRYP